jgi:hypothetical protein
MSIPQPEKSHSPQPYVRPEDRYNHYSRRVTIVANATERGMVDVSVDGILKKQVPFNSADSLWEIIDALRREAYLELDS